MRQLLLLRHAKAAPDDTGRRATAQSDHARPLNATGRTAAASMRRAIRDLGLTPDVVLVSSARRTLQTLEALEPWDETPLTEPMDRLYLATAQQILTVLHGVSETVRSVMVIGHNPGLHELALALANPHTEGAAPRPALPSLQQSFPTCALAEFTIASRWADLGEGGGRLVRFLCPRDFPEMAS